MNEPRKEITRGELHDAVWSKPIKLLAQEWGTTYAQVVKACDEMQVPRPSQGHWQLVARGMAIKRDPLPEPTGMVPNECQLVPPAVRQTKTKVPRKALDVRPPDKENAAPLPDTEPPKISGAEAGAITTGQEFHLQPAVDDAALDIIRQAVKIDFWRSRLSESVYAGGLSNWLGVPEGVKTSQPQLVNAIKDARKDYRAFSVNVDETKDQNYPDERRLNVTVMLKDGFEWKDAWEEAWSFAEQPNQYCLSDNALRLFIWAKGPKNTGRMMDQRKIGAQAKLRKTYSDMEKHLQEIRLKADPTIQWEKEPDVWHGQMRIWFEKKDLVYYHHGPLNPALALNLREFGHAELERFKKWLYDEIQRPGFPEGTETVGVFDIANRKTLNTSFSKLPDDCGRFGHLPDFFRSLRLIDGLQIRYRFEDGGEPWLVICQLQQGITWHEIKARLVAKAQEVPLEKKYTLSTDGRLLLKWILELRSDELLIGLTPPVEEHIENDIGIRTDLEAENIPAYIGLLVEEINENTEFNLRIINWHHYTRLQTRISVKKKPADIEYAVRTIQVFGLSKNKLLDHARILAAIKALAGES